jgi:N6-adenosine-specific RNA methylase IME4
MRQAFDLASGWNFDVKTILTWDKESLGIGSYLRAQTEHCLVAVKGSPVFTLTNQRTIIREKRRKHSQKPEAFYFLVESLCPGLRMEGFARFDRPGWTIWGAEAPK